MVHLFHFRVDGWNKKTTNPKTSVLYKRNCTQKRGLTPGGLGSMFLPKAHFIDKAFPLFEMHKWPFFLMKETVCPCGCFGVAALNSEIIWIFTFLAVRVLTRNDAYSFNTSRKQTILFNGSLRQPEISAFSKILKEEISLRNASQWL